MRHLFFVLFFVALPLHRSAARVHSVALQAPAGAALRLIPLSQERGRELAAVSWQDSGQVQLQVLDLRRGMAGGPVSRIGAFFAEDAVIAPTPEGDVIWIGTLRDGRKTLARGSLTPTQRTAPKVLAIKPSSRISILSALAVSRRLLLFTTRQDAAGRSTDIELMTMNYDGTNIKGPQKLNRTKIAGSDSSSIVCKDAIYATWTDADNKKPTLDVGVLDLNGNLKNVAKLNLPTKYAREHAIRCVNDHPILWMQSDSVYLARLAKDGSMIGTWSNLSVNTNQSVLTTRGSSLDLVYVEPREHNAAPLSLRHLDIDADTLQPRLSPKILKADLRGSLDLHCSTYNELLACSLPADPSLKNPQPASIIVENPGPDVDLGAPIPGQQLFSDSTPGIPDADKPSAVELKEIKDRLSCGSPEWQPFSNALDVYCQSTTAPGTEHCAFLTTLFQKCISSGREAEPISKAKVRQKQKFIYGIVGDGEAWDVHFAKKADAWIVRSIESGVFE